MIQISPAYASKLVKQKNDQVRAILALERETSTTTAYLDEDVSELRGVYDFSETQRQLEALNCDILKLKHAINVFNTTAVLPGLGYTIDAALVRMRMLSVTRDRLAAMMRVQPVIRKSSGYGKAQAEYVYRNYEAKDAEAAYQKTVAELTAIQMALDKANLDTTIEVDIEE